jgi:hypothetical protein
MRASLSPLLMILAVVGCGSPTATQPQEANQIEASNVDVPVSSLREPVPPQNIATERPNPETVATPGTAGGLPDDRTPLAEPNGPIDYKSAEAAGQVVQRYGGLLEQRKFTEARMLWSNDGTASGLTPGQFASAYDKYASIHSEVGKPADMEGAAGSSYITVPFHLYGTLKSGGRYNLVGPLTLRRVNDVPGSTDAQRHWHIERSDLKPQG